MGASDPKVCVYSFHSVPHPPTPDAVKAIFPTPTPTQTEWDKPQQEGIHCHLARGLRKQLS